MDVSKEIKPIDLDKAICDLEKFIKKAKQQDEIKSLSITGLKFVDFFTFNHRLRTVGKKGINFYDFIDENNKYIHLPSIQRFIENYPKYKKKYKIIKIFYDCFKLYFGSIATFSPAVTIKLYHKYKPNVVLDPFAGFGSRLVATSVFGCQKYIGIDANISLQEPFERMIQILKKYSNTEIEMMWENSLDVDYKKIKYDFVFTSPPYYNIETYEHQPLQYKSKKEWNELFYKPIFQNVYENLETNGYFCLNVNNEMYINSCVPYLGECNEKYEFPLRKRKKGLSYHEYIYIWKKPF